MSYTLPPSLRRVRVITSHRGVSRFISECDWTADGKDMVVVGFLARVQISEIPSPYHFSPYRTIYRWNGKDVIWLETAHRRYEVFEVLPQLMRFKTEKDATEWDVRYSPKRKA